MVQALVGQLPSWQLRSLLLEIWLHGQVFGVQVGCW